MKYSCEDIALAFNTSHVASALRSMIQDPEYPNGSEWTVCERVIQNWVMLDLSAMTGEQITLDAEQAYAVTSEWIFRTK